MMKAFPAVWLLAACVFAIACRQPSQPAPETSAQVASTTSTADVERELAKMAQDWVDAILRRDIATLERVLADDFVATLPDGRIVTKAQDIDELQSGAFTSESTTIDSINVRVFGETAIVTFGQTEKSRYRGREMTGRTLWTDVLLKRNGRWQIVAEHGSIAPDRPSPAGKAA